MSHTLFIMSREKERDAIDHAVLDPINREVLYQIVDAVIRVRESSQVTEADRAALRAGFASGEERVWTRAGGWLAKLVEFTPEMVPLMNELASHDDARVRLRLCACLAERRLDDALVGPRLKRFLSDPSAPVRDMAVGVCLKRRATRLLPALEAAFAAEADPELRERIKMAVRVIKGDPYWLRGQP